jgi:Tol biopolymer transport system component
MHRLCRSQQWTNQGLSLALIGILALAGCQDEMPQSPTETIAGNEALSPVAKVSKSEIAFSSDRDGGNSEIYVMTAEGKKQTRLTNNDAFDFLPAWSPDRTKIAFMNFPNGGGNLDIWAMNADGTGLTRLTTDPNADENPDWSPDGGRIAFNRNGGIIVANADGSNERILPNSTGTADTDPDWSPDGTRITYQGGSFQDQNIWTMDADGTNRIQLTTEGGAAPAWSPDGSKIAFEGFRNGNSDIYVMNADGSGETRLTNDVGVDSGAAWTS